ncbi:hypothetical protein AUC61_23815 [Pseudomonas sp. S25]|uniref:Uncharacterized protein n=1 Tax=Pseudomonas maioricensis TaxID=1766623 RepID=A0ABS9ZQ13_9PSED|nr:hypothetical protein [Pseudomonas sp. S25]MCI8212562.1 hypothetical protein [Pseudomonas sp. S25]
MTTPEIPAARPDTLTLEVSVDQWARESGVSPARIKNGLARLRLHGYLKRVPSAADQASGELGAPGNVRPFLPGRAE